MTDLRTLVAPLSVALVGATPDTSKFAGKVLENLELFGYEGRVIPVNPRYADIRGRRCYAELDALTEPVEHVGIAVAPRLVPGVLKQAGRLGIPTATVFSAGYAESGTPEGRSAQRELVRAAATAGVRLLGPNCNGVINYHSGYALTSTSAVRWGRRTPGRVGVVAHSGGVGQVNVMWRLQQVGIEVAYEVSCGNDGDITALDVIAHMLRDDSVTVVAAALESLTEPEKLRAVAAEAVAVGKPLVVLVIGRSAAGRAATLSHTGALTGAIEATDAAFRQWGVVGVRDVAELIGAVSILVEGKRATASGTAAVSISGGNLALLADAAGQQGVSFPPYNDETTRAVDVLMPSIGKVGNPTDVTAAADTELPGAAPGTQRSVFAEVLTTVAADPAIGVVVPLLTLAPREQVDAIRELASTSTKPVVALWTGGSRDTAVSHDTLVQAGVPVFRDTTACVTAVRHFHDYSAHLRREPSTAPHVPDVSLPDTVGALDEVTSKDLLRTAGVPVVREQIVTTAVDAVEAARELGGRVAMKLLVPGLLHKTESGGVRLDVDVDHAAQVFAKLNAVADSLGDVQRSVVVQEFVPDGVELIVGARRDPSVGQVIVVGAGGVTAELVGDVAHRVGAVDRDEARRMLAELKCFPLLTGFRGRAALDVGAIASLVSTFSSFCAHHEDRLAEVDLNPVLVRERGAVVVDALVVLEQRR